MLVPSSVWWGLFLVVGIVWWWLLIGPLKGYFLIPDIGDFENPIFDIDLKCPIFALEKSDIWYWVFNFRHWLSKYPIFKTGKNRYGIFRNLKITGPPSPSGAYIFPFKVGIVRLNILLLVPTLFLLSMTAVNLIPVMSQIKLRLCLF